MAEAFRVEVVVGAKDQTDPGISRAKEKLNGFDKAAEKTKKRLDDMNKTRYQIVLDALDRASQIIGNVSSRARSIAGRTFRFTIKAIDLATRPIRSILNFATSTIGMLTAGAGIYGLGKITIGPAMDFESQQVSMEHWLNGNKKAAKEYTDWLARLAAKTPFELSDLFPAASRGIGVSEGDISMAERLVTLSADMAGLTPGKTVQDAMEALADAQMGEFERMKEFNMKFSKEQMDAIGGFSQFLTLAEKKFAGGADELSRTAIGRISTIMDTVKTLFRQSGIGALEAIKPGLEKITKWISENENTLTAWGEAWGKVGTNIGKWVMSKVEALQDSIRKMTNSQEWKDAKSFGSKMKIAWSTIIAEPFMEWWNSTGKAWLADKASKIGEGIGGAISAGLLALLGVNVSGAVEDGTSIGAAFATGFQKGFDGKKVGEAILNAIKGVFKDAGTLLPGGKEASSTSWLSAGAIGLGIAKLWPLLAGTAKFGSWAGKGIAGLFGKGSKSTLPGAAGSLLGGGAVSTSVMYVNASVVYINGMGIGGGGAAVLPRLTGGATQLALPAAGAAAGASKTGIFSKIAGIFGKNGDDILKVGSKLGKGAKGIPILGAVLGLAASGLTIANAAPEKKGKEAAGEVGSWLGAIGAGAGAGALVGTLGGGPVGTAVGAVVGGVGGAIGGEAFTEWLYDQKDVIGGFFTNTLPSAAGSAWNSIKKGASDAGSWIADKWGGVSDWFGTNVWTPIKDVGISAINITAGIWGGVRDVISDRWNDFSGWFDTNVWQPVSGAAQVAASWLNDRWSEVSGWVRDRWADFSGWFGDNVWTPVKGAAQTAGAWLGDQFTAAKTAISEAWGSVSGWFEANVWGPIKGGATAAWNWVGDKLNGIGDWIGGEWKSFTDWLGKMGAKGSKETGLTTSTGKGSVFEHAWGGIMTKPHMGIVAEEGMEGIIPLSPSKRRRGIDLWQRAGSLLGVRQYEDGGIVGSAPMPISPGGSSRSGEGVTINVNNKIEPSLTFEIRAGADPDEIVAVIKARAREVSDDMAGAMAEGVERIFKNMPMKSYSY